MTKKRKICKIVNLSLHDKNRKLRAFLDISARDTLCTNVIS